MIEWNYKRKQLKSLYNVFLEYVTDAGESMSEYLGDTLAFSPEQAAGRVGRKADGKEFGTVIDFQDSFGMYEGWGAKRMGIYKGLKYYVDT